MLRLLSFYLLCALLYFLFESKCAAQNLTKCGSNEFYCPEPSEGAPFSCLPISWRCDGGIDCQHNGQVYDEVNCPPVNCSSDEFNCGHSCIDADWQCDTEDDCAFGEDEANCTTPSPDTCDDDEFYCSLENECIPRDWHCDGESDCVGDEDEKNCPGTCDAETEFTCGNGACVDKDWKCDAYDDCGDLSDEPASCNTTCSDGEIVCPHNSGAVICIDPEWMCDDDMDCPDGWDENRTAHNCSIPECNQFSCTSGECYPLSWVCDGAEDCRDGSDESHPNCTGTTLPQCTGFFCWATNSCLTHDLVCNRNQDCPDGSDELNCTQCDFRCSGDHKCLSQDLVCNGNRDCSDGSDESGQCHMCQRNNGGCDSHFRCVDSPKGPQCLCREGFAKIDNQCYDINECSIYGKCSQTCVNTHGSYHCKCIAGYQHNPQASTLGLSCKALGPTGYTYVANNRRIVRHSITGSHHSIVLDHLGSVVDLAVDYKNNVIYWNEHVTKTLKKASLSDPSSVTVLVSADIGTPEGLTLDWVRGRLYWVDDTKGTVEVVNTDGTDRRVLKSGLSRPRDIVVNPLEEALYFTVWGTAPGIAKLNTDGSGFTVLVNDSIAWPNGIALDLPGERLYWVDGRHKVIESIKTDGTGRIIVKALSSGQHPYSIAVFENLMFVSDFVEQRVIVFDRFTGEEVRSFSRNTSSVTGVFISQEALQPPSTLCRRPELPYYDTSQFKTPTYKIGDVLTIRCEGQSKLNGSNIVKCGHDGRWFPTLPVCQPLSPTTGTPTTVQTPTPMGQQGVDKRGAKFEGASFGIGFAIGCISLIVIIVILTIIAVILCKRYQTSIRPVGSINFTNPYYKKSSEATISLPSAIDVDNDDASIQFETTKTVTNGKISVVV